MSDRKYGEGQCAYCPNVIRLRKDKMIAWHQLPYGGQWVDCHGWGQPPRDADVPVGGPS